MRKKTIEGLREKGWSEQDIKEAEEVIAKRKREDKSRTGVFMNKVLYWSRAFLMVAGNNFKLGTKAYWACFDMGVPSDTQFEEILNKYDDIRIMGEEFSSTNQIFFRTRGMDYSIIINKGENSLVMLANTMLYNVFPLVIQCIHLSVSHRPCRLCEPYEV